MTLRAKKFLKLFLLSGNVFSLGIFFLSTSAHAQKPASAQRSVPDRITEDIDDANLVRLSGNVHPFARAEFDAGPVDESQPLNHMLLLLQRSPEQEKALQQLMDEQQRAGSPHFHAWLMPEQFGKEYGPSDADIQTVNNWLTRQGFSIGKVSAGRTVIEFSGNASQVRQAFHTELHRFAVNDNEHFANLDDPQIPAALRPVVAGIVSLHNFRKKPFVHRIGKFRRNINSGEVQPLFTYSDVNGTFYGMGPADFAKIYNIPSAYTGAGQNIAIVGRSNINIQDVRDFRTVFGLPANDPQIILNGPDPGLISGDEGESDLDVEWSGAIAPGAKIIFVTTQSTITDAMDGIDASSMYIVDHNLAGVMSISYGSCESALGTAGNAFQNALWQQAAAQGITVVVAAGDNGAAGCDNPFAVSAATKGIAVSGTASTPFNVAVGGTDFDQPNPLTFWNAAPNAQPGQGSAKSYIPEIPWNDSCASTGITGCDTVTSTSASLNIVTGSGGPSSVYTTKPSWQTGFGDSARDLPDISLFASDGQNRSFYIVCQSDRNIPGDTGCNLSKFVGTAPYHDFQAIGGTSAGAPSFAGIMALINQKTGQRQGNANYGLYALGKKENFASCNAASLTLPNTCVFNDIAKGNNAVPCPGGSLNCSKTSSGGFGVLSSGGNVAFAATTGYDLATGLGSVNVANLISNWATPATLGTAITLSSTPTPVNITVDASVSFSGTVTKTSGSGTPTGLVVLENTTTGQAIDKTTLSGGAFNFASTLLPGGSYSVIAHYGGDGTFGASDSAPLAVTVSKQNSTISVSFIGANIPRTTSPTTVPYGSPYFLRIDVQNQSSQPCQTAATGAIAFTCPSGTVTLLDNGAALKDFPTTVNAPSPNPSNVANLNSRGFVEDLPIQLSAGTHPITATYSGDNSYNAQATSNTLTLTISKATTAVTVSSNLATVSSGGSVTLTAFVSSSSNSSAGPSGTVQFTNGTANLSAPVTCTPVGFSGTTGAHCTATLTTALSALYPPASPGRGPGTPALPLIATVTMVLVMLALWILLGRGAEHRRAYAYATVICFALLAAGIVGCSSTSSSPGGGQTRTISAAYAGDANYAGSSGSTVVTVR
ncbi:MAG TPA: Ig-like domain repeat protein [Candidatus Dormibacteraeota bacterium]|nr:Ig-like domain repeat protein [Candidatus Dormibacteraeota bacterium]